MTGFEDTEENCELFLLAAHGVLLTEQLKSKTRGDEHDIVYDLTTEKFGEVFKHNTDNKYFAIANKEDFPKWEPFINSVMTSGQLSIYGTVDFGEAS